MIVRAYYMNREVYLNVPNGSLVFDGNAFVSPESAEYMTLTRPPTFSGNYPERYPVNRYPDAAPIELTWANYWVVKIIGVTSEEEAIPTDVVYIVDPNEECVCGITCFGEEVRNVPVYYLSTTEE
jgi:hypothetical protein